MLKQIPISRDNLLTLWIAPAAGQRGDPDPTVLYAAVGRALTIWESAEDVLASIYGRLVPRKYAKYRFGQETSHSRRSQKIKRAIDTFFTNEGADQSIRSGLSLVIDHFSEASKRRNDFAHWVVQCFAIGGEQQCLLMPSESNSRKLEEFLVDGKNSADFEAYKISNWYSASTIDDFSDKFDALKNCAICVLNKLPPEGVAESVL